MFPGKETRKVADFEVTDKLFNTLNDSAQWGIDMGIRTVGELNDVIAAGRIQDMILVQESYMEQKSVISLRRLRQTAGKSLC